MKKVISVLTIAVLIASCNTTKKTVLTTTKVPNDPVKYANTITAEDLKTALYTYASDEFEGRETGKPGQKKAINFLKDHYIKYGVSAAKGNNDYFQEVPLTVAKKPEVSVIVNGKTFNYLEELVSIFITILKCHSSCSIS